MLNGIIIILLVKKFIIKQMSDACCWDANWYPNITFISLGDFSLMFFKVV